MESFTPIAGLIGGVMIGLAATLLLLVNGRIAGISGILGGIFAFTPGETAWRVAFVTGLVAGPVIVALIDPVAIEFSPTGSLYLLAVSGLLVGFGTRLGNGCTSGHGVCGLARGSRRSLVATLAFFSAAAITVFVTRHLMGG